jgi:hypothetical protein
MWVFYLIIFGFFIWVILDDKNKKKIKLRTEQVKLYKERNRIMLKEIGKQWYIKWYGQEAYNSIINNTDVIYYYRINYGKDIE